MRPKVKERNKSMVKRIRGGTHQKKVKLFVDDGLKATAGCVELLEKVHDSILAELHLLGGK